MNNKKMNNSLSKDDGKMLANKGLDDKISTIEYSLLTGKNNIRPRPISSFTNEPSVFYNPEHSKIFSKRFHLKMKK